MRRPSTLLIHSEDVDNVMEALSEYARRCAQYHALDHDLERFYRREIATVVALLIEEAKPELVRIEAPHGVGEAVKTSVREQKLGRRDAIREHLSKIERTSPGSGKILAAYELRDALRQPTLRNALEIAAADLMTKLVVLESRPSRSLIQAVSELETPLRLFVQIRNAFAYERPQWDRQAGGKTAAQMRKNKQSGHYTNFYSEVLKAYRDCISKKIEARKIAGILSRRFTKSPTRIRQIIKKRKSS